MQGQHEKAVQYFRQVQGAGAVRGTRISQPGRRSSGQGRRRAASHVPCWLPGRALPPPCCRARQPATGCSCGHCHVMYEPTFQCLLLLTPPLLRPCTPPHPLQASAAPEPQLPVGLDADGPRVCRDEKPAGRYRWGWGGSWLLSVGLGGGRLLMPACWEVPAVVASRARWPGGVHAQGRKASRRDGHARLHERASSMASSGLSLGAAAANRAPCCCDAPPPPAAVIMPAVRPLPQRPTGMPWTSAPATTEHGATPMAPRPPPPPPSFAHACSSLLP